VHHNSNTNVLAPNSSAIKPTLGVPADHCGLAKGGSCRSDWKIMQPSSAQWLPNPLPQPPAVSLKGIQGVSPREGKPTSTNSPAGAIQAAGWQGRTAPQPVAY